MTNPLPSGTVTFLFTDIEGSTKLAQTQPDAWEGLRKRHHYILRSVMEAHNGYIFQIIGDAFCVAFNTPGEAIRSAIKSQMDLYAEEWGIASIKVRMGIHTGQAEVQQGGDYQGYLSMSRVQRLMSAGHGGQILISLATQELIRDELPEGVLLRDMGERRLKDLIRPEHIYQLDIAGLPVDFPALKTLDKYRHNLPTQLTSFIGREKEMTEVKQALAEHRLVTLNGSGGAGKTRLSLQVAADSLDQFPNGIWFVELAPLTDPDLIPQTILTAADMQTQQGKSALESLTDFLREKTSLLVMDNCEHLIEACATLANTLLNAAPNLKILASSREPLGIKGEQSWRVPSLSAPDVKHLPSLEQLSQYEAVRLFIDRALLVQPHFRVTNENAPTVAQICYRLDGIPLALELAAARIRVLSVEQIASRLDDRFRLLTGGSRTALPRQQTLRALIDWSYDLLSENERTLLRRLAVFSGGCTLEAAEQVCGDEDIPTDDILDLLTHLVDKSLVTIEEQLDHLRYRILETVRQYAREKLFESGEGEKLRAQHLAYFLKFAEEAEPHLFRAEQMAWLNRLEWDHDNFRSALEWVLNDSLEDSSEAGLRLLNALCWFWYMRGYWPDGHEWFVRALEKFGNASHTVALARAIGHAGLFEEIPFDGHQALKLYDESLMMCRELGDRIGVAHALLNKGEIIYWLDRSEGKSLIIESLTLFQELDDKSNICLVYYHLGQLAYYWEYDIVAAREYYEESLKEGRACGDRRRIALVLNNLGDMLLCQGNLSGAQNYFDESLSIAHEIADKHGIWLYLSGLGEVAVGQGNYKQAEKFFEETLVLAQDLGSKFLIAESLWQIGRVARYKRNYEQATKLQKESLALSRTPGHKDTIAKALCSLGELARLQGNYIISRPFYIEALEIAQAKEVFPRVVAYLLEESAAFHAVQGQPKCAIMLLGAAEAFREHIHVVALPVERVEIELNINIARKQLDEATFNAVWVEGRAMSMKQAIGYALKELEQ